jgi:hypothetical protein
MNISLPVLQGGLFLTRFMLMPVQKFGFVLGD